MAVRPFERGDQESETAVLRYSRITNRFNQEIMSHLTSRRRPNPTRTAAPSGVSKPALIEIPPRFWRYAAWPVARRGPRVILDGSAQNCGADLGAKRMSRQVGSLEQWRV